MKDESSEKNHETGFSKGILGKAPVKMIFSLELFFGRFLGEKDGRENGKICR